MSMNFAVSCASLAAALSALSGCIFQIGADGNFSVEGRIVLSTNSSTSCELQLSRDTNDSKPLFSRKVFGVYKEDFVVAPSSSTYRLSVLCDGKIVQTARVHYGSEVRPGATVRLQEVRL